jgi:mono/diheme cytochrome c family protein
VGDAPYKSPNYSSTMVTASNLVFTGVMTGEFQALDADTGKILWSFQTPSGIVGQPVTWEKGGKQYVTVMSGLGGVYAQRGGDPNLENLPTGVSLWRSRCSTSDIAKTVQAREAAARPPFSSGNGIVFMQSLHWCAKATIAFGVVLLSAAAASAQAASDKAELEAGETVYNNYCAVCHGDRLVSTGQFPNLRRLTANDRVKFDTTVRNGRNQMPPWKDMLSDAEIDQLWAYIRANAYEK